MDDSNAADMEAKAAARQTRFSDVCGTLDELKRMLYEEPEASVADSAQLEALIEDALCMLARMRLRLREYEQFREEFVAIAASLQTIESPRSQEATTEASALTEQVRRGRRLSTEERAEAVAWSETIRDAAVHLEKALYRYKDVTLQLGRAYRAVKGNRGWMLDEAEGQATAGTHDEPGWARWLPVSPHRERILRYLHAGRAQLLPPEETGADGQERAPLIEFEDGGVMSLPVVRWSDEVGNFYPAERPPHPRGLDYRDRRD